VGGEVYRKLKIKINYNGLKPLYMDFYKNLILKLPKKGTMKLICLQLILLYGWKWL